MKDKIGMEAAFRMMGIPLEQPGEVRTIGHLVLRPVKQKNGHDIVAVVGMLVGDDLMKGQKYDELWSEVEVIIRPTRKYQNLVGGYTYNEYLTSRALDPEHETLRGNDWKQTWEQFYPIPEAVQRKLERANQKPEEDDDE